MSISSPTPTNDTEIWASLKQAISTSSSFQHWKSQLTTLVGDSLPLGTASALAEASPLEDRSNINLDDLVQCYLRETLETLAY